MSALTDKLLALPTFMADLMADATLVTVEGEDDDAGEPTEVTASHAISVFGPVDEVVQAEPAGAQAAFYVSPTNMPSGVRPRVGYRLIYQGRTFLVRSVQPYSVGGVVVMFQMLVGERPGAV